MVQRAKSEPYTVATGEFRAIHVKIPSKQHRELLDEEKPGPTVQAFLDMHSNGLMLMHSLGLSELPMGAKSMVMRSMTTGEYYVQQRVKGWR